MEKKNGKSGEQTHIFRVKGMHCASCELLTEHELGNHPKVVSVKSSLSSHSVEVSGDFGDMSRDEIMDELSGALSQHSLVKEEESDQKRGKKDFAAAVPLASAILLGFFLLQKAGIVNLIQSDSVTLGTAFVIGLIASVSSCMAVVGGLILSISATIGAERKSGRLQIGFHAGRIVSFFLLGGAIGILGNIFQFGQWGMFALGTVIGAVMIALGANLIGASPKGNMLAIPIPKKVSKKIFDLSGTGSVYAAILLGAATFFLPCGFTQSMQIYTLSTGDFLAGGLTMLAFSFGTFPMLALVSFGSAEIHKSKYAGVFLKTAGIVVIFFALFNIINAMVSVGWIRPVFNF